MRPRGPWLRWAIVILVVVCLAVGVAAGCRAGSPTVTGASTTTTVAAQGAPVSSTTTSAGGGGPAQYVVYAVGDDTQPGNEAAARNLAALVPLPSQSLELFVYLGDVRPGGSPEDFARYDAIWGGTGHDLRAKTASVLGNHETDARDSGWIPYWQGTLLPPWPGSLTQTSPPYYAVKLGDWKFVILDTNSPLDQGSEQYKFLVTQLQEPGYRCIVCGHHPRWSMGRHGDEGSLDAAWKAMCDYGAVAYVAGHDHGSQIQPRRDRAGNAVESGGCVQLVAGAGGAPLYSFVFFPGHAKAEWRDSSHFAILRLTLRESEFVADFIAEEGSLLRSEVFSLQ